MEANTNEENDQIMAHKKLEKQRKKQVYLKGIFEIEQKPTNGLLRPVNSKTQV